MQYKTRNLCVYVCCQCAYDLYNVYVECARSLNRFMKKLQQYVQYRPLHCKHGNHRQSLLKFYWINSNGIAIKRLKAFVIILN